MRTALTTFTFSRCFFDSLLDPSGAGRNASPSTGVRHRSAAQERQRGSVEGYQSLSDWYWCVLGSVKKVEKLKSSFIG